jgi:outer membrane lipoprotein LolB
MKRRALLLLAAASATLAGCATVTPPTAAPDPLARSYAGRLAVKVEGDDARSFSAGFDLQGTDVRGQLALISPIGTQVGRAVWQPGSVLWQSADGDRRFDSLDALAEEMLGEAVPLAALFDWMAGRPWGVLPSRPLTAGDGVGTEAGFRQLGWNVQTGRVADGVIVAQRRLPAPTLTVRIKLDTP